MPNTTLKTRLIIKNDSAENWTTKNPVLLKGELGIEIDTNLFKIGNGTSAWAALPYANESSPAETTYQAIPTECQTDLEAIATAVGAAELHEGDTAICIRNIGTADHKSYTPYTYNETKRTASDAKHHPPNIN